jgi:malic enzyme
VVVTLEQQAARAYEALGAYRDDLAKHVYLRALQDTNEVLFYKLLVEHVEELLPIIYTPTVGLACQRFSHIYRRNRGLLRDQRVVLLGAGSAGIGVADMLRAQMVADGIADAEARRRFFVVDRAGLLTENRSDLSAEQRVYAQPAGALAGWTRAGGGPAGLTEVVANAEPTILIGLSTAAGAFTESIVRQMAARTRRPIIFPLSNPTARSEADPADLAHWTDGRVLVATGSPYPPLEIAGKRVPVAQCNNVFVFPAVGLGVVASRARWVTDGMLEAARALGELSPARSDQHASLLPPVDQLRATATEIAAAVEAEAAARDGVAPSARDEELRARVAASQWRPEYRWNARPPPVLRRPGPPGRGRAPRPAPAAPRRARDHGPRG